MKNQPIVLNMTNRQAYKILKQMKQTMQKQNNIAVQLSTHLEDANGKLAMKNKKPIILIDCHAINQMKYARYPVNTHDFISCLIAGHHEQRHHQQMQGQSENSQPTEKEKLTALNAMICIHNRNYYFMLGNYYTQLSEIDAEQHGLTDAYAFLKNNLLEYSDQNCQQLIVDYVNQRVQENPYYIPQKEYESLTEIITEFDQSFQKALNTPKPYYMAGYKNYPDIAMQYMWQHDDTTRMESGHSFLHDTYLGYQTGTECEKLIGCITKLQIPTCTDAYIYLKHMDLSPETILGVSLHKDPREPWTPQHSTQCSVKQERSTRAAELEAQYGDKLDPQEPEDDLHLNM